LLHRLQSGEETDTILNETEFQYPSGFPPAMHDLIPLPMLRPGQSGQIGQVLGRADEVHRLHELGIHVGRSVEMVQSGSPCIVRLNGAKLCFRNCDALSVLVRLGEVA
jgi:Fe2+ transport system protein FeoA